MRLTFLGTSHGNHTCNRYDPWHGEGEAELRRRCDEFLPFPYMIAHDGDQLAL